MDITDPLPSPTIEAEKAPKRVDGVKMRWYTEKTDVVEGHPVKRWYQVKRKWAPLLCAIIGKYGDIGDKCTFSEENMVWIMDLLFSLYKKLEAPDLTKLTQDEIDTMEHQINDLEVAKIEVGWLRIRLSCLSKAREHEIELEKLKVRIQQENDELDRLMMQT